MPQRRKSARRSLELHSLMIRRNYSGISFGWEGDTQAFSSFYRLIRRTVLSVCLRICHDHAAAEDACAEVYLLVWRNADKFDRDRGTAMGWVSAIARNQAITCVRGTNPGTSLVQRLHVMRIFRPSTATLSFLRTIALNISNGVESLSPRHVGRPFGPHSSVE